MARTLRRDNKFISYLLLWSWRPSSATNDAGGLPRPLVEFNYHNCGVGDASLHRAGRRGAQPDWREPTVKENGLPQIRSGSGIGHADKGLSFDGKTQARLTEFLSEG